MGCAAVAYLGLRYRHLCQDFYDAAILGKNTLPAAAFDKRFFTYIPEVQQILTFFVVFQAKNTYDTIVFNDGPEYLVHHVLALMAAWSGMYPGGFHIYGLFFMGISEISTFVLCLLANFDDQHGVVGLGEAFPALKISVGLLFVITFIICRVIMWPFFAFHFIRDGWNALKNKSPQSEERKVYIWALLISNIGLSLLQVLFLQSL